MDYKKRPYRKNLATYGLIYMGGEEWSVTIKNLSITGLLAELNSKPGYENVKNIYKLISMSTMVDLYLPEMRLAGDAEVVRVDMDDDHIFIALEFKQISHDVDDLLYKRKAYRKNITTPGYILLDGQYLEFTTINVSADGLMILLAETIAIEEGVITVFEFEQLDLEGQVKVMWVDHNTDTGTLIGLQYMYMVNTVINGIPRFDPKQIA